MALTFAQSTKKISAQSEPKVASFSLSDEPIVLSDSDNENWILDNKQYKYYPEYSDDNLCIVDRYKKITLNDEQMSISQEQNSQVIPFRIYRYYDGYDLSTARLTVFYQNKNGETDYSTPINVYYNDKYIKFFWLLDANATQVVGELKFEIQAHGTNSKGDNYVWKSLINKELNIIQSLNYRTLTDAEIDWVNTIFVEMKLVLDTSEQHLKQTAELEKKALSYSNLAASSAVSAENAAQKTKEYYEKTVEKANTINDKVDSIKTELTLHENQSSATFKEIREEFAQADADLEQKITNEIGSRVNALEKEIGNGYLPLDGSKSMTGDLQVQNGFVKLSGNPDCAILEAYQTQNSILGQRKLVLWNGTRDIKNTLQIKTQNETYNVYHEGNKPTAIDVGALPDTTTAEDIGAASADHTHDDTDCGYFDLDCGYFWEDYDYGYFTENPDDTSTDDKNENDNNEEQDVVVHNETANSHIYMNVDGNEQDVSVLNTQSTYTLEEHLNDVYAHQNIIIDGNIEK